MLTQLLDRVKVVQQGLQDGGTIKDVVETHEEDILDLQRLQLLQGKASSGEDIRPYYSEDLKPSGFFNSVDAAKRYSAWKGTISYPRMADRNADAPNLYINGRFHSELGVTFGSDSVVVDGKTEQRSIVRIASKNQITTLRITMERIPIKENAALFDRVFGYIQTGLANNLSWLNFAFGKAERLVKNYNGKRVYSPNLYVGKNEYELITPDSGIGNYCFFTLDEPEDVSWEVGDNTYIKAPFSLIVWVDLRTIEQNDERNTEAIKQDILRTLNGKIWMKEGYFQINRIWEKAENIFKGFTLDEIDNQFLMHPYCGWRFEGVIDVHTDCETEKPTPTPDEPEENENDGE